MIGEGEGKSTTFLEKRCRAHSVRGLLFPKATNLLTFNLNKLQQNPSSTRIVGGPVMTETPKRPQPQPAEPPPSIPRVVEAEALFRGTREIWIEHAGVRYRLRITRRNKLILQK